MSNRGSAAAARRALTCQIAIGLDPADSYCQDLAVASIGTIRICERHKTLVAAIAADNGATVQVDAPRKRGRPRKVKA